MRKENEKENTETRKGTTEEEQKDSRIKTEEEDSKMKKNKR